MTLSMFHATIDQMSFSKPPRRMFPITGFRNLFAISPVVQQMRNNVPHTWPDGWHYTGDAMELRKCGVLHQLNSGAHVCF